MASAIEHDLPTPAQRTGRCLTHNNIAMRILFSNVRWQHGKGEKRLAHMMERKSPGDHQGRCAVGLRYPKPLKSGTITLAHSPPPSPTVRCRERSTVGDCIGRDRRAVLSVRLRLTQQYPKHLPTGGMSLAVLNAKT